MFFSKRKLQIQPDASEPAGLTEAQLDAVAGGDPGYGVGTAYTSGVPGAQNVVHAVKATEITPSQTPVNDDSGVFVGSGYSTAFEANPSTYVGRAR
jgi:hypothetical protein